MACAIEAERELNEAPETVAASASREKTFTEKISSLTEEMSSVPEKRAILGSDLNAMMTLVQQLKMNVRNFCLPCPQKVQMPHVDMVDAAK